MRALRFTGLLSTADLMPRFVTLANFAIAEADTLINCLRGQRDLAFEVQDGTRIEAEADEIVHQIARELARAYDLRFDRGDLHSLASALDDVVDFSYGAADRLLLYKIRNIPTEAVQVAQLIKRQAEELAGAVSSLDSSRQTLQRCSTVSQLECEAKRLTGSGIAALFSTETDAIELIKLKDLFSQLASATERANDSAQVIETLVLKRGPA